MILSEWADTVLIRNCNRRSSHRLSALTWHHTQDNRKNIGTRPSAFVLRSEAHIADK